MSTTARLKDTNRYEAGALNTWCGIVAGTLEQFAQALSGPDRTVTPAAVLQAIGAHRVPILNDTAELKGTKPRERPTDPSLRSLAMTIGVLEQLREAVSMCDDSDHVQNMCVPQETNETPKPMNDEEKSADIRVRVPPQLKAQVKTSAAREGRSVSGWIRHRIARALDIEDRVFGTEKEAA